MKNLRYLITVLALFNISMFGAASAAAVADSSGNVSTPSTGPTTMALHTGNE